jgi:Na+/proline symporter
MSSIDWILLVVTLLFITFYGIYKNRGDKDIDGYLLGDKSLPWYHVGFSVMATQASAITFLSAPGQAFTDGMRFVQFYFGLPLAMIVLCVTFVPIFHRLKVYTAYEYLETRFDGRVRVFTAMLFLIQRGLSTGISIYAPSLIMSAIFGWEIFWTNILMGGLVLTYTVVGGTKAISHTHLQQMIIMTCSLFFAGYLVIDLLPADMGLFEALQVAGKADKLNAIDFDFNPKEKYNVWSGLLAGFFLQLSYFGTDQSQVSRYLTGSSIKQSRIGLLMNGMLKIPMQFMILLLGAIVFVFYMFNTTPIFFNEAETERLEQSEYAADFKELKVQHTALVDQRIKVANNLKLGVQSDNESIISDAQDALANVNGEIAILRTQVTDLITLNNPDGDANDINYIFLRFILDNLPQGLVGLLVAIIFTASMGSIASAYNSLAATSVIDIYRKTKKTALSKPHELAASKYATVFWGIFCIFVAYYAHRLGSSMIEIVNILGSWFYGVILGIFVVAFYFKRIGANATFIAACISQVLVIYIWYADWVAYLWLNPIGCILVVLLGFIAQLFIGIEPPKKENTDVRK